MKYNKTGMGKVIEGLSRSKRGEVNLVYITLIYFNPSLRFGEYKISNTY